MAGEVGHIVYGARLLTFLGDKVSDPSYWIGNVFPDIRHMGVVSRHRTHIEQVSLGSLVGQNDFMTGMRVHAWLDATRSHFLQQAHIKENLPWHPFVPHALKLVEDELLYDHYDDWNLIHRLLQKVYDNELTYINEPSYIIAWHDVLQKYFAQPPSDTSRYELSLAIGLSANSAEEVNNVVHVLQQDPRTQALLEKFWRHLEDILR